MSAAQVHIFQGGGAYDANGQTIVAQITATGDRIVFCDLARGIDGVVTMNKWQRQDQSDIVRAAVLQGYFHTVAYASLALTEAEQRQRSGLIEEGRKWLDMIEESKS